MIEIKLYNGDCLKEMNDIEDNSIDCIICDLPYGTTKCEWDNVIDFNELWSCYHRILKPNSTVVLFASGLFTYHVYQSNVKDYKYKLIWKKNVPTGMTSAKYRPMKYYEELLVFQNGSPAYNPQLKPRVGVGKSCYNYEHYCGDSNHVSLEKQKKMYDPDFVQPSDVLEFDVVPNRHGKIHPTQKPVDLIEWIIKTYTNKYDTILDNCMGSGSTGIACLNTERNFIGIEMDNNYFNSAKGRIFNRKNELERKLF
jgi:site-specific DNA-methyltransferase (adenine-specific)